MLVVDIDLVGQIRLGKNREWTQNERVYGFAYLKTKTGWIRKIWGL